MLSQNQKITFVRFFCSASRYVGLTGGTPRTLKGLAALVRDTMECTLGELRAGTELGELGLLRIIESVYHKDAGRKRLASISFEFTPKGIAHGLRLIESGALILPPGSDIEKIMNRLLSRKQSNPALD